MHPSKASTEEYWFIFQGDRLLLKKGTLDHQLPTNATLSQIKSHFLRQHKLGQFNHVDCYCAEIGKDSPIPADVESVSLRKAFELLGSDWYTAAVKAYSVINWDKNHQYCGRCGSTTIHHPGTFERVCRSCGLALYPRISPSIIVLIQKEDHILLARSPHFTKGAYGLIAGFVEVGESVEEAVHREVAEEIGITIKNLQYFGSQSWPFPDSLMIGFIAEYASGEIIIDNKEIEAANWYPFDQLPGYPSSTISIAKKLIDHVVAGKKKI